MKFILLLSLFMVGMTRDLDPGDPKIDYSAINMANRTVSMISSILLVGAIFMLITPSTQPIAIILLLFTLIFAASADTVVEVKQDNVTQLIIDLKSEIREMRAILLELRGNKKTVKEQTTVKVKQESKVGHIRLKEYDDSQEQERQKVCQNITDYSLSAAVKALEPEYLDISEENIVNLKQLIDLDLKLSSTNQLWVEAALNRLSKCKTIAKFTNVAKYMFDSMIGMGKDCSGLQQNIELLRYIKGKVESNTYSRMLDFIDSGTMTVGERRHYDQLVAYFLSFFIVVSPFEFTFSYLDYVLTGLVLVAALVLMLSRKVRRKLGEVGMLLAVLIGGAIIVGVLSRK